jgi:ferrous iron transport protein A
MTLSKLPPHQEGQIVSVDATDPVGQRMMAMGFLPGMPVKVVQVAPFGDPITVELGNWRVSLRMSEASLVETEPLPNAGR